MKVYEILEAKIDKPFGNAIHMPRYNADTGHMSGHQRDWLTLGNADLADVKKAIVIVKTTDAFKLAEKSGLKYESTPMREKAGSLYFIRQQPLRKMGLGDDKDAIIKAALRALKTHNPSLSKNIIDAARLEGHDYPEFAAIEKSIGDQKVHGNSYYIVYPNGQVRVSSDGANRYSLIKSLKPRMVPGDPVKSLVKTYTAGIERMIEVWTKSKEREEPYYSQHSD
jgi:hypothetical protein